MMLLDKFKSDSDWQEAFSLAGGNLNRVQEVIASDEGANDGPDWIAIVRMDDGQFAKVFAGCDYTGWG